MTMTATLRGAGFSANILMTGYVLLVCWAQIRLAQGYTDLAREPRVEDLQPVLHFEELGELVGLASHGQIDFTIHLKPFVLSMADRCSSISLILNRAMLSQGNNSPGLNRNMLMMTDALNLECRHHARRLTHMLTAWVTEKDLLAHPDLKMPFDIYHRGHDSAAAPLDHEGREEPGDRTDKYHGFGANDFSDDDYDYEDFVGHHLPEDDLMPNRPYYPEVKGYQRKDAKRSRPSVVKNVVVTPTEQPEPEVTTSEIRKRSTFPSLGKSISSRPRNKRFVGILTALGLGALGATALTGAFSSAFSSSASEAELRHVASDLRAVTHLEEHQIQALNRTFERSMELLLMTTGAEEFLFAYDAVTRMLGAFYEEVSDLVTGLEHLLHKSLSPRLVRPDELKDLWVTIYNKLAQYGSTPIGRTPLTLYSLDVGHSFEYESLTIKVRMLVPGEKVDSRQTLFRYTNFPIALSNEPHHFGLPVIDNYYLGVRHSKEETVYRTLSLQDFQSCRTFEGVKTCHLANVEHRTPAAKCLTALYSLTEGAGTDVVEHCKFVPAIGDYTIQTSPGEFHLYLSKHQTIHIDCGQGKVRTYRNRVGLVSVHLPLGCTGLTEQFRFIPDTSIIRANRTLSRHHFQMTDIMPTSNMSAWRHLLDEDRLPATGMTFSEADDKVQRDIADLNKHTELYFVGMAVLCTLGVILCCFLARFFVKCSLWHRQRNDSRKTPVPRARFQRQGEELEMNIRDDESVLTEQTLS